MKRTVTIMSLTLLFLLGAFTCFARAETPSRWSPGLVDLSDWDPKEVVALTGPWEFYWQQLLTPEQFRTDGQHETNYVSVPATWSQYKIAGVALSNKGFATYRLQINTGAAKGSGPLALYMRGVATSYQLRINGQLAAANGTVGTTPETMHAVNFPQIVYFQPKSGVNEIVIHAANFVQRKGGIWETIRLGRADVISREQNMRLGSEMFIVGSMLIMGLYHLSLFAFRKKDKSALFFGLVCFAFAARIIVVGEAILFFLFPAADWEAAVKIEYISVFVGLTMMVLFVRNEYAEGSRSLATRLCCAAQGSFALLVLCTPARIYTELMLPYQLIVAVPTLGYVVWEYVRALLQRKAGSAFNAVGVAAFSASVVLEILFYNQVLPVGGFVRYGILLFLFTQSANLSSKFARTSRQAELLADELRLVNETLEKTVQARTLDLQQTNRHLAEANRELTRMSQMRRQLLSDISHEMGTPITAIKGYARAVLDGLAMDDAVRFIERIHDRTYMMERLIDDLLELSKLEARQIRFDFREVPLIPFFRDLYKLHELDMRDSAFEFIWEEATDEKSAGLTAIGNVDCMRLEQVIDNFMSNARKYTQAGGTIRFRVELRHVHGIRGEVVVSVIDSGPGISDEEAWLVFDRFYRVKNASNPAVQGTGLGLAICKEIISYHYGRIGVDSTPGEGSRFYFILPARLMDKQGTAEEVY